MLCDNCRKFSSTFNPSIQSNAVLHESISSLIQGATAQCHLCSMVTAHLPDVLQIKNPANSSVIVQVWGDNLQFLVSLVENRNEDEGIIPPGKTSDSSKLRFGIGHPDIPVQIQHALKASTEANDNRSTGSTAALTLVSAWVKECLENHSICSQTQLQTSLLPNRVIDVGSHDSVRHPFLYESFCGEYGRYIALSHCWGKERLLTTTTASLEAHKKEIAISTMPKTFLDAVKVTRELGIPYLWIDSLCIVQDDPADWEKEASRMCNVYQNALLTIAATHAKDGAIGLYVDRDSLATIPCELFPQIFDERLKQSSHTSTFVCVDKVSLTWAMKIRPTPLHSRAWVLQEQLLSNRILSYEDDGISWRCQSMRFSEKHPMCQRIDAFIAVRKSKNSMWKGDPRDKDARAAELQRRWIKCLIPVINQDLPVSVIVNETSPEWEELLQIWISIVQEFTERGLTRASDRLIAIQGISDALAFSTNAKFLAGLLSLCFYKGLLWCTWGQGKRIDIAPTWSWASVDGEIRWPGMWSHHTQRLATILNVELTGSTARRSGLISIEADIRLGMTGVKSPGQKQYIFLTALGGKDTDKSSSINTENLRLMNTEFELDRLGVVLTQDIEIPLNTSVWFAAIARTQSYGQSHEKILIHCLVLQESDIKGQMNRIGYALWNEKEWKSPSSTLPWSTESSNIIPEMKRMKFKIQ